METTSARGPATAWTVALGPGTRLSGLDGLLRPLSAAVNPEVPVVFERLDDLAELLAMRAAPGRLILDADQLPSEDLGFVRRFLAAHPAWSLLLVGEDAGRRTARALLALARTAWLAWPPDLGQLEELVRAPAEMQSPAAVRAGARAPAVSAGAIPRLAEQLGTLAGLARELERACSALRTKGSVPEAEVEGLSLEVGRVRRFTQTLAWLSSPPRPASERVDLGELLEEKLAALTLRGRKSPRFLFRGVPGLRVRAEPEALSFALESVLLLARGCAPAGEVIRVQLAATTRPGGPAEIEIDFPAGALTGLALERLVEPFALEGRVPELSPSDLAAARSVVAALGGAFGLSAGAEGHALARISLPVLAQSPSGEPAAAVQAAGTPSSAEGPFA